MIAQRHQTSLFSLSAVNLRCRSFFSGLTTTSVGNCASQNQICSSHIGHAGHKGHASYEGPKRVAILFICAGHTNYYYIIVFTIMVFM